MTKPKVQMDRFLGNCVVCRRPTDGPRRDYCHECIEQGQHDGAHFGRCYQCHDGDHELCIGVPCQCECPTPDQRRREELRERALSKLTPQERAALGV